MKDVSFNINAGETIAIVGHTGSGKTTIISLLNRLYHIQKGVIRIDDVNIENYNLDSLRKNVGVVLQDVFLSFWKRRKELDIQSSLAAYLQTSVRYKAIHYIEKN